MKFQGTPNLILIDKDTGRKIGQFDDNGIFECDNPKYFKRLSKFKVVGEDNAETKPQQTTETETKIICKKCGKEFDNKGVYMTHCRKDHPKGGD
jgi:hypothetical protein